MQPSNRISEVRDGQILESSPARVITKSRKYERGLTYSRRHELHWLDIPEGIQFRIAVTVYRCLNGLALAYLTELCTPVTQLTDQAVVCGRHFIVIG